MVRARCSAWSAAAGRNHNRSVVPYAEGVRYKRVTYEEVKKAHGKKSCSRGQGEDGLAIKLDMLPQRREEIMLV
jgi:hypothetical protein